MVTYTQPLIREGTNLNCYEILYSNQQATSIAYYGDKISKIYRILNIEKYNFFWKKYKRPPEKDEFLKILERSATLYSEKYRRDTGGEYTPTCFVEVQNEILNKHYNLNDFIIFDPCAGVGNLENQFGKDYKANCYLSTLEQMDVDICKLKGFENCVQFDYLKNKDEPKFKYKGSECGILEICKKENKKLMVIMNPPYQRKKEFKNNLAIEFFNKIVNLKPEVIVYYCKTEFFFRDTVKNYVNSNYKIVKHIFSNAKDTFQLSEWSVSQIIFDKNKGEKIDEFITKADRYDLKDNKLEFAKTYTYDMSHPNLIKEIENEIKENQKGMILENMSYLRGVINLTNKISKNENHLTTGNLR